MTFSSVVLFTIMFIKKFAYWMNEKDFKSYYNRYTAWLIYTFDGNVTITLFIY